MADLGNNEVAIAALALAGTLVAAVVWVVKYLANTLSADLKEHTKAALIQADASTKAAMASKESTAASKEVLTFMKKLNGKLENATIQKVQEQMVEHQTVNETHKQ